MTSLFQRRPALAALALAAFSGLSLGAPGDTPRDRPTKGAVAPAASPAVPPQSRTASLPARGLFVGDRLSDAAKAQLAAIVVEAIGLQIEVSLVVPTGPWQIDGSGKNERDLTPARLQSVRRFLTERGIDAKRIFVESHIDASIAEPRLDVQMVARPARD